MYICCDIRQVVFKMAMGQIKTLHVVFDKLLQYQQVCRKFNKGACRRELNSYIC